MKPRDSKTILVSRRLRRDNVEEVVTMIRWGRLDDPSDLATISVLRIDLNAPTEHLAFVYSGFSLSWHLPTNAVYFTHIEAERDATKYHKSGWTYATVAARGRPNTSGIYDPVKSVVEIDGPHLRRLGLAGYMKIKDELASMMTTAVHAYDQAVRRRLR